MTAGDPGAVPGQEQATAELRRLLLRVLDDDRARAEALSALLACRVLAGTWPTSAESVRTLTNSDGEQAMPLFSGRDELSSAARRFGWTNSDGSVSLRELDAREALASALAHGVHFVVIDICAEHALELGRDELAAALALPAGARSDAAAGSARSRTPPLSPAVKALALPAGARSDAAAESARSRTPPLSPAVKIAQVPVAVPNRAALLLGEIDMPFAAERATGRSSVVAIEEVAPTRPRKAARPDPRVDPTSAPAPAPVPAPVRARRPSRATAPVAPKPSAPRAPAVPIEGAKAVALAPAPLPASPAFELGSADDGLPVPRAPAPQAKVAHAEFSGAALPPLVGELPPLDRLLAAFPEAQQPAFGSSMGSLDDGPQPEARPAALEAAVMVAQIAKMGGDQATQDAAAEVAEMLKDLAKRGGVEENKPSAVQSAAKTLAGMLSAELAADHKRGKRGAPAKAEDKAETGAEVAPAESSATEVASLHPPQTPLEDAVLDEIAEGLRKYPEVQWACELADGAGATLIGVRIEPTFMTHADEIKSAIVRVAVSHKTSVSVLLLGDAQQMREARAQGIAFFPWRKRGAKR